MNNSFERKIFPYLFLLPTMIIFSVFLFWPALNGLWISLHQWDGLNPMRFIGFENFTRLAGDAAFRRSLWNTVVYSVITVPAIYVSSLGLALILTRKIKGVSFFRAVFYWPTMISSIIVGLSWRFLLGEEFGLMNYLVTSLGASRIRFFTDPRIAMGVIIFVTAWSLAGYYMVMFIAGIKAIDHSYYEAAQIDGANNIQQFFNVTLPLLKPTSLLVLVLTTITVIRTYPLVFALTQGGPAGATRFVVQSILETGFERGQMGYASSMAVVLFVILSILTLVQFKMNREDG